MGSQEKIGFCGRTGAGKSSIGVCLFRLVELAKGKIVVDGVDISGMRLSDVRSKMSIIPQDPVLFSGTIRYNLDPFNEHSEEEMWEAVRRVHLSDFVHSLEDGLDSVVSERGDNFSSGQKQLICIGRALLRNSKIILMDEATSSVDIETDSVIQQTIREEFKHCTVLIIAHRLETIMVCDRIVVMDTGVVAEADTPANLLNNPNSKFSALISEMNTDAVDSLRDAANKGW
eukprot:GFYU01000446.1.p1 GENE.GFYU01000446.1~~GFYU01000446.1.p1  ORF type:complete len:230 (-),score=87.23 GFYU01000446.1:183-872(-)